MPRDRRPPPYLLELDVVVGPELRPWRYPPPLDFHYSESLRDAFERGELKLLDGRFPFERENDLLAKEIERIDSNKQLIQFAMFDP